MAESADFHFRSDLVAKARAKRAQVLAGARERCEEFVEYAIRHEQDGTRLTNEPFHVEWQQEARAHEKLVLFAPVEHAKTTHLGVAKPLHALGQNHDLRIGIISNSEKMAQKNLRAIRQHIAENPRVREVFPTLKPSSRPGDPWHNSAITVDRTSISKDPSIQVFGAYGAVVGSRLDLIVIDDILDFDNTRTPEQRDKLIHWFETTVFTRMTPGARLLVIGTPWHPEDLMHVLASRPGFAVKRYSAVHNPDDPPKAWRPIWPTEWPLKRLLDRYENTREVTFLRKYLCRVRIDSAGRFRASWVHRMVQLGKGRTFSHQAPRAQGGESRLPCFTGVDLGVGKKLTDARTVIHTNAIDERGRKVVVNIQSGHWTAPEIIDRLHRNYLAYGSVIYVENNAAQQFLVQIAQQLFPVQGVHTGNNKHHEEYGVEALAVQIRNGWWVMPSGSAGDLNGVPDEGRSLISEMLHYSPEAHTGDRLMAAWICSEASRKFGMPRAQRAQMQER